MEHQLSFANEEYARKKKTTRRDKFLAEMNRVVPWARLVELILPHYPKGKRGRPPIGIEKMLRVYFLQQWYGLADEALEDTIYDSQSMRGFAGINLGHSGVPDATTLLNFRHLLEAHELTKRILEEVNAHLTEHGLLMREGTLVDATIIAAPSSTKNKSGERDPEMHQTKKGNQWCFGMKAHIGADAASGLVHSVTGTAANVSDISQTHELLHGEEKVVHADAGYIGVEKRPEIIDGHSGMEWRVAARRGKIKALPESWIKDLTLGYEKLKARTRALVEHPFHIVKNLFKHRKARYRGIKKNTSQLEVLFCAGESGHRQEGPAERGIRHTQPANPLETLLNHPAASHEPSMRDQGEASWISSPRYSGKKTAWEHLEKRAFAELCFNQRLPKPPCRRFQRRRARRTSSRSCSAARSVFFYMSAPCPRAHSGLRAGCS